MHACQQACAGGAEHARAVVKTGWNARIAALDALQRHGAKAHQIRPNHAQYRGGDPVTHTGLRCRRLQPAHGKQQADDDDRARHGVAQAGQLHGSARQHVGLATHCKRQRQRQRGGEHGTQPGQPQAVECPVDELVPQQVVPAQHQRPQHEQHGQHKTKHDGCRANSPGQRRPPAAQLHRRGIGSACARAPAGGKAHALLGAVLNAQQHRDKDQQHRRQLRGSHAVVHRQPGLVDAGGKGLDAKVAGHAKISQCFHQRQRHAGSHSRARQRQGHLANAARQRRAQQSSRFHQMHGALRQGRARQQIHIRVQRRREHQYRAAQTAHFGQQAPLQPESRAQPALQRPAVLQKVGVGIGQHIRGHGQRQQQGPFKNAPPRKLEQRDGAGRRHADSRHAHADQQAQQQRCPGVVGQHGLQHLAQDGARFAVKLQPRQHHRQHRQCQQKDQHHQQSGGKKAEKKCAAHENPKKRRAPAGAMPYPLAP